MQFVEYDLNLTEEERQIHETARKFAAEVLRPTGIALDRMSPEAVVASDSPFFSVMRQANELGFSRMSGPPELGGMGASPLAQHLVLEELTYGNVGLAGAIFLSPWPAEAALATGNQDLIAEFSAPYFAGTGPLQIGAWSVTEHDHGSDTLSVIRPEMRIKGTGQLVGRRDGDSYVLNGQKSAWCSNGPVATHAVVNLHLEPRGGLDRGGVCVIPLNLPGISRGRPLDKHGLRALPQARSSSTTCASHAATCSPSWTTIQRTSTSP